MPRGVVKRLYDLEIDEVSLVDRSANQHAAVTIAKRAEDGMPGIYDEAGDEVFETELAHGDVVYDDDGNEFVYVEDTSDLDDDGLDEPGDEFIPEDFFEEDGADLDERELAGVGKAFGDGPRLATMYARDRLKGAGARGAKRGKAAWAATRAGGRGAANRTRAAANEEYGAFRGSPRTYVSESGRATGRRAGRNLSQNRVAYAGAAGAGGVGYGSGRKQRASKSLGDTVLEELSKALDESDRDEAIAKAMDYVEAAREEARDARRIAKNLENERDLEDFTKMAGEYDLPVDPAVLGTIMKRAADRLDPRDVAVLDRIFKSVGEQLYLEEGSAGRMQSSGVMDQVEALAEQYVGKGDSGLSSEQAVVAIFENDPQAYDEYLSEIA